MAELGKLFLTTSLAVSDRIIELCARVVDAQYWRDLFGWDVNLKTLGLHGFDGIGQAVAKHAALGFDMAMVFHAPFNAVPEALAGLVYRETFDESLQLENIVVLTLPLVEQTKDLMDKSIRADEIRHDLRKWFAECDRARTALVEALDSGHLRAAGLDRFATESLSMGSALRTQAKVSPLPHISRWLILSRSSRRSAAARGSHGAASLWHVEQCRGSPGQAARHSLHSHIVELQKNPASISIYIAWRNDDYQVGLVDSIVVEV